MAKKMASNPNRLDTEDFCKNIFDQHLRSHYGFRNIAWQRHPNGRNSPPDFNLSIDKKLVSVEVTLLTKIRADKKEKVSDATYQVSRIRLVNKLEEKALEIGALRGRYVINFHMRWLVPLNKAKRYIEKYVLDYIRKSRDKEGEKDFVISFEHKPVCEIKKIDNINNRIFPIFTDAEWTESLENVSSAREMVQQAILCKIRRLRKENIPQPWVLLLYNTYPFVSEKSFRKCEDQKRIEGKELFDWIYIIPSQNSGFDFYLEKANLGLK